MPSINLFNPVFVSLYARGSSSDASFYEMSAREIRRVLKDQGVFLADFSGRNDEFLIALWKEGFEIISLEELAPSIPSGYLLINHKSN